ncbi:MAG TPA: lasso peptide biosynthesis PqqD family chaperone [Thermoanaerobaculia bacterium]|nr:lasso peptide biosynthesis PqqD family chaperone [Thermoanaerobaculia bacterium]
MTLSGESTVVVSKDQMASDIAGETVILGLTAGRYYGLDAVGARVWQLIQTPAAVPDLVATIMSEYEVGREQCEADLLKLLRQMIDAGLVEVRG